MTDVITLKWKTPLLSWKDCFSGTTCAIRPLLNVSEEIAAKNQQLPVDGRQKECNYFYLLSCFFFHNNQCFFCLFWPSALYRSVFLTQSTLSNVKASGPIGAENRLFIFALSLEKFLDKMYVYHVQTIRFLTKVA